MIWYQYTLKESLSMERHRYKCYHDPRHYDIGLSMISTRIEKKEWYWKKEWLSMVPICTEIEINSAREQNGAMVPVCESSRARTVPSEGYYWPVRHTIYQCYDILTCNGACLWERCQNVSMTWCLSVRTVSKRTCTVYEYQDIRTHPGIAINSAYENAIGLVYQSGLRTCLSVRAVSERRTCSTY